MAGQILIALTILATLAALNFGLPTGENNPEMAANIAKVKEAIVEQDIKVGMDSYGRIFFPNVGNTGNTNNQLGNFQNKFNLSATLAGAPNNTVSFNFISLATLFGFPNFNNLG